MLHYPQGYLPTVQWGNENSSSFLGTVTYLIQFPNSVFCTFLNDPGSSAEAIQVPQLITVNMPYSTTGFQFFERQVASDSGIAVNKAEAYWLSIGY